MKFTDWYNQHRNHDWNDFCHEASEVKEAATSYRKWCEQNEIVPIFDINEDCLDLSSVTIKQFLESAEIMNQTVVVIEYQTREDWCHCCNQKLPEPKTSEIRRFEFNAKNLPEDMNWAELDEDDFEQAVEEYVWETIGFFATRSGEQIIIKKSELGKFKQFVLSQQ